MDARSTAGTSSVQDGAARLSMLMLDGASIPSVVRAKYRRWRDRHAQPSPLARVLASIEELFALGLPRERVQLLASEVQRRIDRCYGALTTDVIGVLVVQEMLAEHEENMASLRYLQGDTSPEACREWANALRRENALQDMLIGALEAEAAA